MNIDDEFWTEYFINKPQVLKIYSHINSLILLRKKFYSHSNYSDFSLTFDPSFYFGFKYSFFVFLNLLKVKFKKSDTLIIQGFEELSLSFFLLLNFYKIPCIQLVVTNNLGINRFTNKSYLLRFLLQYIFTKSSTIIVHSQYEKEFLLKFFSIPECKVFVKKYHLISWNRNPLSKIECNRSNTIIFIGPTKKDKVIKPFLELVINDKNNKFDYLILNVKEFESKYSKVFKKTNVTVKNGFLSEDEYNLSIKNSKFLFLGHNFNFEPKLSGNLCDSLREHVPFISDDIYPAKEFEKNYFNIGLIIDFSKREWFRVLLDESFYFDYEKYFLSLKKMHYDFSKHNIHKSLDLIN